jgi:hypothetical protein
MEEVKTKNESPVRPDSILAKILARHPQIVVQIQGITAIPICLGKSAVAINILFYNLLYNITIQTWKTLDFLCM